MKNSTSYNSKQSHPKKVVFLFAFIRIFEIKINMGFNFSMSWGKPKLGGVEINEQGNVFYSLGEVQGIGDRLKGLRNKTEFALTNVAFMSNALKVTRLGSQVRVMSLDSQDNIISNKALYDLMPRANTMQSWTEFIASVMLYANVGVAVIYIPNNRLNESNTIHCLKLENITYSPNLMQRVSSVIGLNKGNKLLQETGITYEFEDGSTRNIKLSELHFVSALPIGIGNNFFENITLVDILNKVLINTEELQDLEYKTSKLAQKVMIGTRAQGENLNAPMGAPEKESIERSITSDKFVTATNKDVKASRLIESKAGLEIEKHTKLWFNIVGDLIGISPDLGIDAKSTYNNQQLATGRTIEFAVLPILEKLIEIIEQTSDLTNLKLSFEHMGFNQVFEKEREEKNKVKLDNVISAFDKGLITEERAKELTNNIFR